MFCYQCGKKLSWNYPYEVCVDCAAVNLAKIFSRTPELAGCFLRAVKKVEEEIKNEQI